jgi:hypothetical protein
MAALRNLILPSLGGLLLAACDPQPRLNVAWYMYPPSIPEANDPEETLPPPDPRKSEIILYIGNAGGKSISISDISIGDTVQNTTPFTLEGVGSYRIVSYLHSAAQASAPPVKCRIPTSMRVFWSKRANKSPKWSKPINFGGKSPAYIPDAWFDICHVSVRQTSP